MRSPGRKPRRSPASTAGRVRMIRLTSRRLSAAAASATARNVLPVPAGPMPNVIDVLADRVDVALLVDGLRRDLLGAVLPDDVLEDLGRRAVLVQRAGDGGDRAGRDVVALLDERGELLDDDRGGVDRLLLAVEREHVAAQPQVALDVALERAQHRVAAARQLGCGLVGELDLQAHQCDRAPLARARRRACRRRARRRPPSRPSSPGPCPWATARRSRRRRRRRSRAARRRTARPAGRSRSAAPRPPRRSASSSRPASRNADADSSRRLRSRRSTASSSAPPSLAAFCSSLRTSRSAPTRSFSPLRIAETRSCFTVSASVIWRSGYAPVSGLAVRSAPPPPPSPPRRASAECARARPSRPSSAVSRPKSRPMFQSTSSRARRPAPGIIARW